MNVETYREQQRRAGFDTDGVVRLKEAGTLGSAPLAGAVYVPAGFREQQRAHGFDADKIEQLKQAAYVPPERAAGWVAMQEDNRAVYYVTEEQAALERNELKTFRHCVKCDRYSQCYDEDHWREDLWLAGEKILAERHKSYS